MRLNKGARVHCDAVPSRIVDTPLTCPIKNEISAVDGIIL
jgi:hypothetical protein